MRPVEAFVCEEMGNAELVELLRGAGAEILPVTAEVYEKLCFGERDEAGVVVVAQTPRRGVADLKLPAGLLENGPLVAVIEGVEKPGNVGAILRSADAAGVDAVVVADGGTDLFNPNTIRASLGTVYRANVVEATTAATIAWLRTNGLRFVVARPDAKLDYTAVDFAGAWRLFWGARRWGSPMLGEGRGSRRCGCRCAGSRIASMCRRRRRCCFMRRYARGARFRCLRGGNRQSGESALPRTSATVCYSTLRLRRRIATAPEAAMPTSRD